MTSRLHSAPFVFTAIVTVFVIGSSLAAYGSGDSSAIRAPAGQMCPNGSYVIGFDSEGNIICNEACSNGVLNTGEARDDGNTETGDGCSAPCQSEGADTDSNDEAPAVATSAADPGSPPSIPDPVITDVEPSTVVFGTSEVAIKVIGTGFHADSVIIFEGSKYKPVVNQEGTRLDITIATAKLDIASYAIKVSNGSGLEATLKRALVVY